MVKKLLATMAAVCACALALVSPLAAFAAPGDDAPIVVYDGAAKAWHGKNLQEQDVIAVTRDVMPGDSFTQEFDLAVRRIGRGVTLSMRPEADAATLAALSDMSIELADGSGALIARGTLEELTQAGGAPLPIGTYTSSATTPLRITLTVPTSVDNESQGETHAISWVFTAQEDGGGSASAESDELLAQTGDSPLSVYGPFVLGALGILLVVGAAVVKRRN